MKKLIYRSISLFLVIAHLVVFCGKDLAIAADNNAKVTSKQVQADSKTSSSKNTDSSDSAAQAKASQEIKPRIRAPSLKTR